MENNGSPSCASKDGENGSRPASTYKGMEYIGSALTSTTRRTGGTHMLLGIAAGRQVGLGWEGSIAQPVGKSDSRLQGVG